MGKFPNRKHKNRKAGKPSGLKGIHGFVQEDSTPGGRNVKPNLSAKNRGGYLFRRKGKTELKKRLKKSRGGVPGKAG